MHDQYKNSRGLQVLVYLTTQAHCCRRLLMLWMNAFRSTNSCWALGQWHVLPPPSTSNSLIFQVTSEPCKLWHSTPSGCVSSGKPAHSVFCIFRDISSTVTVTAPPPARTESWRRHWSNSILGLQQRRRDRASSRYFFTWLKFAISSCWSLSLSRRIAVGLASQPASQGRNARQNGQRKARRSILRRV